MTNVIKGEVQKLDPGARIEMYIVDATALGGTINRFCSQVNELGSDIVWQGNTYYRFPIEATGFEYRGSGTSPRPRVRVSNVGGFMGSLLSQYDDLVGATFTRKRTLVKYLDAVNFAAGNAGADTTAEFPNEIYFVDRKSSENKLAIEWELASVTDLAGVMLPARQVVQTCSWLYRGTECGYGGGPVATTKDLATTNSLLDECSKTVKGCKFRFGTYGVLPYGGFPSAGLYRG